MRLIVIAPMRAYSDSPADKLLRLVADQSAGLAWAFEVSMSQYPGPSMT